MTVKAVIFDLDGTLAATLDLPLSSGGLKRVPFDVLRLSPAGKPPAAVTITDQHRHLPGELIARGYRTAIITRSPSAYASTLTGILQLDTERLLASSTGSTPATKLGKLSAEWDIPIGEMLYVGDTDQDREEAVTAGAQFRRASADMPAEVLDDLPGPGSDDASTETTSPIIPGGSHIDWRCGNCKLALAMIREQLPTVCPGCQSQLLSPQQAPPAMREVIDTVLGETPSQRLRSRQSRVPVTRRRQPRRGSSLCYSTLHDTGHAFKLSCFGICHKKPGTASWPSTSKRAASGLIRDW